MIDERTRNALTEMQLENIVTALKGRVKHLTGVDYTGKTWKKIEIIYDETEPV